MSGTKNSPIEIINLRFSGLVAWDVVNSHGSFISMHFGSPRLQVNDIIEDNKTTRRTAHIHGDGELWIYMANWIIFNNGSIVASSDGGSGSIKNAMRLLQGQRLLEVRLEIEKTNFIFDLDTTIVATSSDVNEAQWIFSIDGHVFYEHIAPMSAN